MSEVTTIQQPNAALVGNVHQAMKG